MTTNPSDLSTIDSGVTLLEFNPGVIPWQMEVTKLVRKGFDYDSGNLEILLSGSYGSAKSILMAHLIVTHCLDNPGARGALCRRGLPDLKKTILKEVIDHIYTDLREGIDYNYNKSENLIRFKNGSEIICITWADKRYMKARSLKLSFVVIEEIVENNLEDKEAFDTIKARLRRLPDIKENVIIAATNPDSPGHWVYKYWIAPLIAKKHPNRRVFYSLTEQNPFLDPVYIQGLRESMTKKEADRFLRGLWIDIRSDFVYYAYTHENNFIDRDYEINLQHPICISFDFNIAEGKPLSACLFQYIDKVMHIYAEVVVEGFRTRDAMEEMLEKGMLDYPVKYFIHGDASGKHRDTRSLRSDYDIINMFMANETNAHYEMSVPRSNPPIRKRHNAVNAQCCNDLGEHRLFVYKGAPTADEALRLTKLKKGGTFIEDDSDYFQHISTAIGYGLMRQIILSKEKPTSSGTM